MPIVRLADCVRQQPSKDPKAGKCFRCGEQGHFWKDKFSRRYCNNPPLIDKEQQRKRLDSQQQSAEHKHQQPEPRQRAVSFLNRNFPQSFAQAVAAQPLPDAESKRISALEAQLSAANNKISALEQELKEQKHELKQQKAELQQQRKDEQQCKEKAEHLHRHLNILTRCLVSQMVVGTEQLESVRDAEEKLFGSVAFGQPQLERKGEYPFADSGLVDLPQLLRHYEELRYAHDDGDDGWLINVHEDQLQAINRELTVIKKLVRPVPSAQQSSASSQQQSSGSSSDAKAFVAAKNSPSAQAKPPEVVSTQQLSAETVHSHSAAPVEASVVAPSQSVSLPSVAHSAVPVISSNPVPATRTTAASAQQSSVGTDLAAPSVSQQQSAGGDGDVKVSEAHKNTFFARAKASEAASTEEPTTTAAVAPSAQQSSVGTAPSDPSVVQQQSAGSKGDVKVSEAPKNSSFARTKASEVASTEQPTTTAAPAASAPSTPKNSKSSIRVAPDTHSSAPSSPSRLLTRSALRSLQTASALRKSLRLSARKPVVPLQLSPCKLDTKSKKKNAKKAEKRKVSKAKAASEQPVNPYLPPLDEEGRAFVAKHLAFFGIKPKTAGSGLSV